MANKCPCPLCGKSDTKWDTRGRYECGICGAFQLDRTLELNKLDGARHLDNRGLFTALAAATRQENFFRRRELKLTLDNYESYAAEHQWKTVSQKLHQVLQVARKLSSHFGSIIELNAAVDFPLFDAISKDEAYALVHQILKNGLIESRSTQNKTSFNLSAHGWEVLEPIHTGGVPGRCFVAMAFDPSLDEAYYEGIKRAIVECGYEPVCLKEVTTNDDLCDLILSELRKAQFVIADFTKQKGGVYFEAGFAKALGKEVFWTCRADDFHLLHFDTNHYGHIRWNDPKDLRTKLSSRIMAELGKGPH